MVAAGGGSRWHGPRRWLFWLAWFAVGWLTGVTTLLVLADLSSRTAATGGGGAGDSDIRVQIHIHYLNDVVRARLRQDPPVVAGNIKTTDLQLGLAPRAGLVLTPTFDVAGLFQLSPSASNQLSVRNGKLALTMIGQPRLGDLQIPLDLLPFDLTGEVHQAVDQITNTLLLTTLNDDLRAGFGSDTFTVTAVQTLGSYLEVRLKRP